MSATGYISAFSGLIPLILGLSRFARMRTEMKILVFYFLSASLVDTILILQAYNAKYNLWLIRYFTPLEYSLFALVFSYWQVRWRDRFLVYASIAGLVAYFFFSETFLNRHGSFDSYTASLEGLVLIGVSSYTLINLKTKSLDNLTGDYRFWICSAVLIYFSGNLLLFSWSSMIAPWWIHNLLNIAANLLFAKGILCLKRR